MNVLNPITVVSITFAAERWEVTVVAHNPSIFDRLPENSALGVTSHALPAKYSSEPSPSVAGAMSGKEDARMHSGYWLEFWWMSPIALGICITV